MDVSVDRPYRWHELDLLHERVDGARLSVTQEETTASDGVSEVHRYNTHVWVYDRREELTARQARVMGLAYLRAADLAERIEAGTLDAETAAAAVWGAGR